MTAHPDPIPTPDGPLPRLLDRLFEPPPDERTAVLAGGLVDEAPGEHAPAAVRYAYDQLSAVHARVLEECAV